MSQSPNPNEPNEPSGPSDTNQPNTSRRKWTPDRWMTVLPDDTPISELNIPGAHNAAAINKKRRTRWACQDHSISDQLNKGIRLLDIRLKPKPIRRKPRQTPAEPNQNQPTEPNQNQSTETNRNQPIEPTRNQPTESAYEFITCHGYRGILRANEYQPFEEVQKECNKFLEENPGETIIMLIKVDNWQRAPLYNHPRVLQDLQAQLKNSPIIAPPHLPTLKECRGKIYLLNRINNDPALGVPLYIPDNTPGATLPITALRQYEVYVQDRYKQLNRRDPEAHKLKLTLEATHHKKPGAVLLNFASATKPIARFVYIMRDLANHQTALGWLLLDYALTIDLPSNIIESNF